MICGLWQVGYPDRVVIPGAFDCGMLSIVIFASFFGQMLLNHSFQIQNAAKGSSINCTQVNSCVVTFIPPCWQLDPFGY